MIIFFRKVLIRNIVSLLKLIIIFPKFYKSIRNGSMHLHSLKIMLFFLSLLLQPLHSLCIQMTSYLGQFVQCIPQCPPNSITIQAKCLTDQQYLINENVHHCQGLVTPDRKHCCRNNKYPVVLLTGQNICAQCDGYLQKRRGICCDRSEYLDSTNGETKCTKIGTGKCDSLKLNSRFKFCCEKYEILFLKNETCMNPVNTFNCDYELKVCCPSGEKINYEHGKYQCVEICQWGFDQKKLYCIQRNCFGSQALIEGPFSSIFNSSLYRFRNQCCYGLSPSKQCITDPLKCQKVFYNIDWSVCCQHGQFYNISAFKCTSTCEGIILFEFFCLKQINMIDFTKGSPKEVPKGLLYHQKIVPSRFPFCCPQGFYINDNKGCLKCSGRIYQTLYKQICCQMNEYFDEKSETCQVCEGKLSKEGTLCCFDYEYIGYSSPGVALCTSSCPQESLYHAKYCCYATYRPNECSVTNQQPTICSYFYKIQGACSACPMFCPDNQALKVCASENNVRDCQENCPLNMIFNFEIQQCLACDISCKGCTKPFDNYKCQSCQSGYTFYGNKCVQCHSSCLNCQNPTINGCLSCDSQTSLSVLRNGRCLRECPSKSFYSYQSLQCEPCSSQCEICDGPTEKDCIKCQYGQLLPANFIKQQCFQCDESCKTCWYYPSTCLVCNQSLVLNQNTQTCLQSCLSKRQIGIFSSSFEGKICTKCHPSCASCEKHPQNCTLCINNTYFFIDSNLGINICTECQPPCLACNFIDHCESCLPGYYLDSKSCIQCYQSCQTCKGPLESDCLACKTGFLYAGSCQKCKSQCTLCNIDGDAHEILRISILLAHLSFQSIIFWSFTYLIQPHLSQPEGVSYEVISKVLSVLFLVFVLGLSAGAFFYYFRSYRQNALEFIYSFREGIHFLLILCQAVVFSLSIGKPLIGLCLIGMEVCWLIIQYLLYRIANKGQFRQHKDLLIVVLIVIIGYFLLALCQLINWIFVVAVCIVAVGMCVLSAYKLIRVFKKGALGELVKSEKKKTGKKERCLDWKFWEKISKKEKPAAKVYFSAE